MNWDIGEVWLFTRSRLGASWEDLDELELSWRPSHNNHSIAEILVHIAAAEHYWVTRLMGRSTDSDEFQNKLDRAVRQGFLIDGEFPFGEDELNRDLVSKALEFTFREIETVMTNPTTDLLEMKLKSPIGDNVTGKEGLIRLAQHAGYHTGQIWLMRMLPNFPAR